MSGEAGRHPAFVDLSPLSAELTALLGVRRWADAVVAGGPYQDVDAAVAAVRSVGAGLSDGEVDEALGHHPRIGERPRGDSAANAAAASQAEQGGIASGHRSAERIADGNRRYEARFGRVFLIRAAGRSTDDVLVQLEQRLLNDDATELRAVRAELVDIGVLRTRSLLER